MNVQCTEDHIVQIHRITVDRFQSGRRTERNKHQTIQLVISDFTLKHTQSQLGKARMFFSMDDTYG